MYTLCAETLVYHLIQSVETSYCLIRIVTSFHIIRSKGHCGQQGAIFKDIERLPLSLKEY
jgi:hypothetical protein